MSLREVKAELGVSEMTIRRDFALLQQRGLVRRTRGGVMMAGAVVADRSYDERQGLERVPKQAIGMLAATLVEDGDTIFLSGGTTALELGRALGSRRALTVITNSIPAVVELTPEPGITVVVTGGVASLEGEDLCGPVAEATITRLHATKAFIGASGITSGGVFNSSIERAAVDRRMIEASGAAYVLADHTKIGRVSLSQVVPLERVTGLITDSQVHKRELDWLERAGVDALVGWLPAVSGTAGVEAP